MDDKKYYEWTKIENPETDLPDYGETVLLKLKNGDYITGSLMRIFTLKHKHNMISLFMKSITADVALITDVVAWMRIKPYGE